MTLYRYSDERVMMQRVKWLNLQLAIAGVLIGLTVLFGILYLASTTGQRYFFPSAFALAQENTILQDRILASTSSLEALDIRLLQIDAHNVNLTSLLQKRLSTVDSIARARAFAGPMVTRSADTAPTIGP